MFFLRLICQLLSLYAVLLLVHFALPYITSSRCKWMETLDGVCAPAISLGKTVLGILFPDKQFNLDPSPLAAALICWAVQWLLSWFL